MDAVVTARSDPFMKERTMQRPKYNDTRNRNQELSILTISYQTNAVLTSKRALPQKSRILVGRAEVEQAIHGGHPILSHIKFFLSSSTFQTCDRVPA